MKGETKRGSNQLFAAVMALAMIACAIVAFIPSENTEGATDSTTISGAPTLLENNGSTADGKAYYITGDVTIQSTAGTSVVYLVSGSELTLPASLNSATITIYAVSAVNADGVPTSYYNGLSFTGVEDGSYAYDGSKVTTTQTTTNYGIEVKTGTNYAYYPNGATASAAQLTAAGDKVTVKNGSITVSGGTLSNATFTPVDTIVFDNVVSTSGVTATLTTLSGDGTTYSTGDIDIAGSGTVGDITITAGKAGVTTTGIEGILNGYSDGTSIANTIQALGSSAIAQLTVYGTPAANQTVTLASSYQIALVGANLTNLTVKYDANTTVGSFSASGSTASSAYFVASGTSITLPVMTGITNLTLVSGSFATPENTTAATGSYKIENATLTVANGASLNLGTLGNTSGGSVSYPEIEVSAGGKFYVAGALTSTATTASITVAGASGTTPQGQFIALGGATIPSTITVSGAGYIDFSGMAGTEDVSGTITGDRDYGQAQNVNVVGDWTVTNNSLVIIRGDFTVNKNVTVTIKAGSTIVIVGDTSEMDISGTLSIEAGASFIVVESEKTSISGTVNNSGAFYINEGDVEILDGGVINSRGVTTTGVDYRVPTVSGEDLTAIASISAGITTKAGFTVAYGAALNIYGDFNIANTGGSTGISNKGTVTLDGAVAGAASTITMAGNGAVVDIVSVGGLTGAATAVTLTITDGIGTNTVLIGDATTNTGSFTISDLSFTESITTKNSITTYAMDISGAPEVTAATGSSFTSATAMEPAITLTGTGLTVSDSLVLGEYIDLKVGDGTTKTALKVTGTITGMDSSNVISALSNGEITVTGMMQTRAAVTGTVNAAHYTAKESNVTYNYYTSLATAIENGATPIDIMGTVKVIENMTIPAGTTVNAGNGLIIGDSDHRDIIVTVEDGATLNGTAVTVNATLEFEDKTDNSVNVINSDVSVIGDVSSSYTNIYTALLGASEGDKVTVTKPVSEGSVILTSDLTVPAGVTLEVPLSRNIQVNDGVTLTVDGTMITTRLLTQDNAGFSATASETQARLIVNGTFMSMDEVSYGVYKAAGAYYGITGSAYNYLTSVELAADAENVLNGEITINGDVAVGDITFTGTETQTLGVTLASGSLSAGTITLSRAGLIVADGAEFEGTVSSAVGAVDIVNTDYIAILDLFDEDDVETFAIVGTPGKADSDGAKATVTVASGNVAVITSLAVSGLDSFTVASGATLVVTGQNSVLSGSKVNVDGTLVAENYGKVNVTDLMVMGTFTVEPSTAEEGAGSATITNLYVGTDAKTKGNSAATVNGTFSVSKVVVSAASTVDSAVTENLRNVTEVYVEGALYATAYAVNSTTTVDLSGISVENADVIGFSDEADGAVITSGSTAVKQFDVGDEGELYAVVDYNIYTLYVVAGNGVGTVAVNGIVMEKVGGNTYSMTGLKAGTYTITYTVKTGYEGTSTMTVDGKEVSDYKVTFSGTESADRYITANLSDIDPNYTAPVAGGDDGLGLTDYLLIILVVLIVVMAIMVALRLMRS